MKFFRKKDKDIVQQSEADNLIQEEKPVVSPQESPEEIPAENEIEVEIKTESEVIDEPPVRKKGFFGRITDGLTKTRRNISESIGSVLKSVNFRKLDGERVIDAHILIKACFYIFPSAILNRRFFQN